MSRHFAFDVLQTVCVYNGWRLHLVRTNIAFLAPKRSFSRRIFSSSSAFIISLTIAAQNCRNSFCSYLTWRVFHQASVVSCPAFSRQSDDARSLPFQSCWLRSKEGKGTTWTDVENKRPDYCLSGDEYTYPPTHRFARTYTTPFVSIRSSYANGAAFVVVSLRACVREDVNAWINIFYALLSYFCVILCDVEARLQ